MFQKVFFSSKARLTGEIVSPLSGFSSNGGFPLTSLVFNYPQFEKYLESANARRSELIQKKYQRDHQSQIASMKDYVNQNAWSLIKSEHNSSIDKDFTFDSVDSANEFINNMKEKCDELDHHPCWTFRVNHNTNKHLLNINLTSHFANNNVTDKDYELASYLTREYESMNKRSFYRKYKSIIDASLSIATAYLFFCVGMQFYKNSGRRGEYLKSVY